MAVAPSLLTSSGSNCTRHRSAWLRWGSAGLRGSTSQRQCRLCVRGRRMCVEAPGVCARAHRLMGEEWASALTRYPTHTRRELQEKHRERRSGLSLLLFTLRRRTPERLISRCVNELVLELEALRTCCPWQRSWEATTDVSAPCQ